MVEDKYSVSSNDIVPGSNDLAVIGARLEAKSKKGPRNHFRGDGMLEDVTHASSPD